MNIRVVRDVETIGEVFVRQGLKHVDVLLFPRLELDNCLNTEVQWTAWWDEDKSEWVLCDP